MIVSIIIFLLIFSLIVVSHEFGHYIVGKKNGIHAVEFFVGLGPKIFKWTKDDTEFSIKLLPFGGACVFEGMDPLEAKDKEEGAKEETDPENDRSFNNAPVWGRFATALAGPLFNIVLAYICGVILAASSGVVIPVIRDVVPESGAAEAGIKKGDIIKSINGHSIHLSTEVSFTSFYSLGEPMDMVIERDGEEINLVVTPKYYEEDQRYYIGITNGKYYECGVWDSLKYGFYNVEYILRATIDSLRMMFTGQVGKDDLAGPVGIVKIVDETYDQAKEYGAMEVVLSMLNLVMLLSANLAVMNLLPLPALDGGRLVFLLIEAIRGKPVPPEKEGYVHLAGMALLFALVIFVFVNDITKFFR